MKLRNHTISVHKLFYNFTISAVVVFFACIICSNMHNTYADADGSVKITDTHFVTIYEDGKSLTIKTDAKTVGEAISRAKIELADEDLIDPVREEEINADNYNINIHRARPVIVTDGVNKKYIMSASYDTDTLAKEAGFDVYDGDKIVAENSPETLLEVGLTETYKIKRGDGSTITVEEDIPFKEKTEPDDSLEAGQKKLVQLGEIGKKKTVYSVKFIDGKEAEREKVSEEVIKEPVDRITAVGTKVSAVVPNPDKATCESWMRAAGISEEDMETAYWIIFKESKCRYNARNASSGAYGIPQSLPGDKMKSAGADWETNPVTQIKWMISYVNKRYGGWTGAKNWWLEHHWY